VSDPDVKLRDGKSIAIRPIRPDDKVALTAAFERLSPESRYRRFFRSLKRLSASDLRYLTEVDHRDHEALVALDGDGQLIGVARYIRSEEDPASAEVAVTVVDDWQGRGVASELLTALVRRAREEGITHFLALVLGENRNALELFQNMARNEVRPRSRDGHLELVIELPRGGFSGTALGRALREAAAETVEFNPLRLLKRVRGENRPER
jgi:GNAT superfamily N-acetyltransferase